MRLIDADAMKEEIASTFHGTLGLTVTGAVHEIIDKQPPIDPESLRPISRLMHDRYGGIKCENCGCCVSIGGKNAYHNAKKAYRFCPKCGAKMEEALNG